MGDTGADLLHDGGGEGVDVDDLDAADFVFYEPPVDVAPVDGM